MLLTSIAHGAPAADYYVSTNGNDANDGLTSTSAWRTVHNAVTLVGDDATINIGPGEFVEPYFGITSAVTLCGQDLFSPTSPPLKRLSSRTLIRYQYTDKPSYPLIDVLSSNVVIENLTLDTDADTNGCPDASYAIYTRYRPITVKQCTIRNVNGFGIAADAPAPELMPSDTEDLRCWFIQNSISNITSTNIQEATAIYTRKAPATIASNVFVSINGSNANAAIYINRCYYTSNMSDWVTVNYNYFSDCLAAVRANTFGDYGEEINIEHNTVEDGLIGIRVTDAKGRANILNNNISVSGLYPSGNPPARGIWVHADRDPWNITNNAVTDHLIAGNSLYGSATNADGTIGVCLAYDTSIQTEEDKNNGVRATTVSNLITGFDLGISIKSGTNKVGNPHNPLVEVKAHYNDIENNFSYGVFRTGSTNYTDATSNWWGSYFGPTGATANPASTNVVTDQPSLGRFLVDTDSNGTHDAFDTDDDGDLLLDTFEMSWGTEPDNPDTDSDGADDYEEWVAGTYPTNSDSVFEVNNIEQIETNAFVINWNPVSNRTYMIYRNTNIVHGSWNLLTNDVISGVFTDRTATGSGPYYYYITVTN